jgi:SAM-dependent methyltransferase
MAEASIVFDRAAGYYDETRGFPPGIEEHVAERVAAAGGLSPASRVLEIGIGTGRIAAPLAARVGRLFGVDLSKPMLDRLREKVAGSGVLAARADASRLPVSSGSFDAVVGVHVFHLIPRWREVLRECARVLRPGGRLLHGLDEQQSEPWSIWRREVDERIGYEPVGVPRARLESFPEDEGWRPDGPAQRIGFVRRVRPQQLLDQLEQRTWSSTWRLGDDDLASAVAVLRDHLLARFGALDRPIELATGFCVRAYQPPA